MHRDFRALLGQAEGVSQFVIAVFVDIRGFSAFSQETESPDAAMYIKRVYARLIDEYFSTASFYKPTGDGLMVIIPYREETLADVSATAIRSALGCLTAFPDIGKDDPMINFPVPDKVGLGIARGTACRLFAGEKTLDYSGRLLNLAARLMNLARPSGVVVDADFKLEMIPEPERAHFREEKVYLRGIAEDSPRSVYLLDSVVKVPKENLARFGEPVWRSHEVKTTAKKLKALLPHKYFLQLPSPPDSVENIVVKLTHPLYRSRKPVGRKDLVHTLKADVNYACVEEAGIHTLELQVDSILQLLRAMKVPGTAPVSIKASYRELSL
jgi:class 3 adenylate cyclase